MVLLEHHCLLNVQFFDRRTIILIGQGRVNEVAFIDIMSPYGVPRDNVNFISYDLVGLSLGEPRKRSDEIDSKSG